MNGVASQIFPSSMLVVENALCVQQKCVRIAASTCTRDANALWRFLMTSSLSSSSSSPSSSSPCTPVVRDLWPSLAGPYFGTGSPSPRLPPPPPHSSRCGPVPSLRPLAAATQSSSRLSHSSSQGSVALPISSVHGQPATTRPKIRERSLHSVPKQTRCYFRVHFFPLESDFSFV